MDDVWAPAPSPEPAAPPPGPVDSIGGRWLDQHRDALLAWNEHLERHGLPLAKFRPR